METLKSDYLKMGQSRLSEVSMPQKIHLFSAHLDPIPYFLQVKKVTLAIWSAIDNLSGRPFENGSLYNFRHER